MSNNDILNLPKGWEMKKLGDICQFVRGPFGGSLKKDSFKSEGYAVYEQQHAIYDQFDEIRYFIDEDKFNEMKRFELKQGDLIMSCSGTMGKVAIAPESIKKGIINQALLKLSPSKKIMVDFLKLWIQSESFQSGLKEYSGGAAIQNVASVAILKQIEIPLPPLAEQQRIVSILDASFAVIAQAKAHAEQNLNNVKELFENYLQSVFENKGADWETKMLKEIGIAQTGTTPKTADKENYGNFISFIKPSDIDIMGNGEIRYDNEGLSEQGLKTGRKMLKGSILMVCIGATIGKVGFADRTVSCNQQINSLTVHEKFYPKFIYYALRTESFFQQVIMNAAQATLPIINKGKWEALKISFPKSKTEQQTIVAKLDALSAATEKLTSVYRAKVAALGDLKKAVLEKAFSGGLK
ncbi:MAG: type restriction enzyme subunit [Bacteroidota bacterium]|jgi:type I restriction enzyme S subunit